MLTRTLFTIFLQIALANIAWPNASVDIAAYDPFTKMTSTKVYTTVGASIDASKHEGEPIFHHDVRRLSAFEDALESAIIKRLNQSGITVSNQSTKSHIDIFIGGHKVNAAKCGIEYVFYFQVSVYGEDQDASDTPGIEWGNIGEASEKQLEAVLIESIVRSIEEHGLGPIRKQ